MVRWIIIENLVKRVVLVPILIYFSILMSDNSYRSKLFRDDVILLRIPPVFRFCAVKFVINIFGIKDGEIDSDLSSNTNDVYLYNCFAECNLMCIGKRQLVKSLLA